MIASIVLFIHFLGFMSVENTVACLYVTAALLIVAEIGVVSFGLLAINGLLAFYAAYTLQTGAELLFGLTPGWPFLFGVAFVELIIIVAVVSVHIWIRKQKTTTGTEGMIGQTAVILDWMGTKGRVRFEGEIWNAKSAHEMELSPDDEVQVSSVNKLDLTITA